VRGGARKRRKFPGSSGRRVPQEAGHGVREGCDDLAKDGAFTAMTTGRAGGSACVRLLDVMYCHRTIE
jgi:hypothetical protein